MRFKSNEKWILEPVEHLQKVSFLKGEGFYSTRAQAEYALEARAERDREKARPHKQEMVYRLVKSAYQIRKVMVHGLY